MQSVLTDCPTARKLGWLSRPTCPDRGSCNNYDVEKLLRQDRWDIGDSQTADVWCRTSRPEFAIFDGASADSPEWAPPVPPGGHRADYATRTP